MLVLSRRVGEKIIINPGKDQITITVVDISYKKIRLGIDAPPEISINREEIQRLISSKYSQKSSQ